MRYLRLFIAAVIIACMSFTCVFAQNSYRDGVYEGEYSFIRVRVRVMDGKMTDIEMLHHGGGGARYEKMVEPLITEMVDKQTTDVDAVTGATVSSKNFAAAVSNALNKAAK